MEDDFRIAVGHEPGSGGLQLRAQVLEVVDLAVEHQRVPVAGLTIGSAAIARRSMIDRRRWQRIAPNGSPNASSICRNRRGPGGEAARSSPRRPDIGRAQRPESPLCHT